MRALCFATSVVWLAVSAYTPEAQARSAELEATGLANVEQGDVAKARDAAIANALKQAIAQVAGQYVQSHFSATQSETAKNQETEFLSRIEDRVSVDVQGFVETYKVLKEGRDGATYKVTVQATVNTRKLSDLVDALADALDKAAVKPRVLLLVQETDLTGAAKPVSLGLAGAFIEGQLAKVGLEVKREAGDVGKLKDNVAAAVAAGKRAGVHIVAMAEAEYRNLGVIAPGAEFEALVGQTRAELKVALRSIVVGSGKLLSSKPVSLTSVGINYDRALGRALGGSGDNAIKQVTKDFFEGLLRELQSGPVVGANAPVSGPMTVVVDKVGSFKKEGRGFIHLLEKLRGVKKVEQRAFDKQRLELSVDFDGSLSDLERAIFAACENHRQCQELDKKSSSSSELFLTL